MSVSYKLQSDGLLAELDQANGRAAIQLLRARGGFKYGNGSCGRGLYSPTWDRQLGYWWGDIFLLNPSLLHWLEEGS